MKRLIGVLIATDDVLLDVVERFYHWVYDRTGAPKGAIMGFFMVAAALSGYWSGTFGLPFATALTVAGGVIGLATMAINSFVSSDRVNLELELFRQQPVRRVIYSLSTILFLSEASIGIAKGWPEARWFPLWPVISYLALARTRDRRPPPRKPVEEKAPVPLVS